jgi:glycerol-3-phosphate dehydrogenase
VLDASDLGHPSAALTIPHAGSISRYVFALPQQSERVIVGLTDEDASGPVPRVAAPTESEIRFLLETLNRVLRTPIRRDQVRGAFAGLRPLIDSGAESTADVSRRHLVAGAEAGFVTVLGGKLTTYRRMAQDAVDLASRLRHLDAAPSRTASLRLTDQWFAGPSSAAADHEPSRARIEFAVRSEGAMTADDVLDRRTRIGLVQADRDRASRFVESVVAETLASLS